MGHIYEAISVVEFTDKQRKTNLHTAAAAEMLGPEKDTDALSLPSTRKPSLLLMRQQQQRALIGKGFVWGVKLLAGLIFSGFDHVCSEFGTSEVMP